MTILWRDESLVAVDKPSGLAVHRGWANDRDVMMTRVRDAVGAYVYPVHRLDRGTSGVLLFALSSQMAALMGAAFAAGTIEKSYLALVRGVPDESGLIEHPLRPGADKTEERVEAATSYTRIEIIGRYSVVEARPRTGRLHQVRRHFKHISCPLIGDVEYGKGEHNRLFRERFGLHRLFLHASVLRLAHPGTGEPLLIQAPLPPELEATLTRLRAWTVETAG